MYLQRLELGRRKIPLQTKIESVDTYYLWCHMKCSELMDNHKQI